MLPEHIVGLAEAILRGELVEPMLADALMELGMPATAEHFLDISYHHSGQHDMCVASLILAGKRSVTHASAQDMAASAQAMAMRKEFEAYQRKYGVSDARDLR